MPTTTKMGIVYPSSTDLVKDGATAMGTISTTVDSKTGLVLLNTTSFSAVSSFSLAADTFTANFETYKLVVTLTGTSADSEFFVRLRASGSDNSTANYNNANTSFRSNNTANNYGSAGATAFAVGQSEAAFSANANFYYDIDIVQPKLAVNTKLSYRGQDTDGSSNYVNRSGGGLFNATTQFDSASFYVGSGTFGGKYSVFGYNL
jgi:hypothetical protein